MPLRQVESGVNHSWHHDTTIFRINQLHDFRSSNRAYSSRRHSYGHSLHFAYTVADDMTSCL